MHTIDSTKYYPGLLLTAFAVAPDGFAQGANGDVPGRSAEQLSPAAKAERLFTQPVRAGDPVRPQVLEPSNRKGAVGRVAGVARTRQGAVQIVVRHGGLLGYGACTIAVPAKATALPDWTEGKGVAPDQRIRVGVNREQYP